MNQGSPKPSGRGRNLYKHGMYKTAEYHAWESMKQRCLNSRHPHWKHYGGRGITVCERWMKFENFLQDMGMKPFPKASLERLRNSDGYSPENCAWKSQAEQMRNTRQNVHATITGVTKCITEWCEIIGRSRNLVMQRIHRRRWTPERALLEPLKGRRPV